ncbi:hypothetical protein MBLNU230_g1001t1 [Neophaeotheca triangularis]
MPAMPVNEHSNNISHTTPQPKRLSHASSTAGNNMGIENVRPSPRSAATTTTPPVPSRLLAQTKASAAKSSPSATRLATPISSQPVKATAQANSKLPRKTSTSTPSTSPATTSKWASRVADRVASNERAAREAARHPNPKSQKYATPSPVNMAERSVVSQITQSFRLRKANQVQPEESSSSRSGTPASSSSRNIDKALPSRPIASLANTMSPSKDSRCLLDASEKPLRIQIGNAQHEWPTLTPNSASSSTSGRHRAGHLAQTRGIQKRAKEASNAMASGEDEFIARAGLSLTLDGTADEDPSRASSYSSYTSVAEIRQPSTPVPPHPERSAPPPPSHSNERYPRLSASEATSGPRTYRVARTVAGTSVASNAERDVPATPVLRSGSMTHEPTTGMPVSALASEIRSHRMSGYAKTPAPPGEDERAYSPQPLNFSKPRPSGRNSSAMSMMSFASDMTADTPQVPKTASRIPLADPKKATLVDIKSRPSSDVSSPTSDTGLNFGSRRVDAPGALRILDEGVKRRQKQSRDGEEDVSDSEQHVLKRQPTGLDRFPTSSPEGTIGFSESDEDEVTTPTDRRHRTSLVPAPLRHSSISRSSNRSSSADIYYTTRSYLHGPPSNSIYTAPLEAIKSQAALPLEKKSESSTKGVDDDGFVHSIADRQPLLDAHSNLVRRLSMLEATSAGAERDAGVIDPVSLTPNTKRSMREALRNVQHEDGLLSERGGSGLDKDTRIHIDTTLSMLEGNADAPMLSVDDETLNEAFGHLRHDLNKKNKSLELAQNIATANQYLARSEDANEGSSSSAEERSSSRQNDAKGASLEPVVSKWSESTSSAQSPSPPDYPYPTTSAQNTYPDYAARARGSSTVLSAGNRGEHTARSIGYPSRVSPKPSSPPNTEEGASRDADNSTPPPISTEGQTFYPGQLTRKVPGSIKHARAGERISRMGAERIAAPWGFGRGRDPSPIPTILPPPNFGPRSSSGGSGSKASSRHQDKDMKTPRSRSKSRLVLKKMTGLFSAKKDKSEDVPPVPRVDKSKMKTASPKTGIPTLGSSTLRTSHTPPTVKMPTLSQPPPSSLPRSTSITSRPRHPGVITPMRPSITASPATAAYPAGEATEMTMTTPPQHILEFAHADEAATAEAWSLDCEARARREPDPAKKHRLLVFAKALSDVIIWSREAQLSAETALQAATSAKQNAEIAAKGVATLLRVARRVAEGEGR